MAITWKDSIQQQREALVRILRDPLQQLLLFDLCLALGFFQFGYIID